MPNPNGLVVATVLAAGSGAASAVDAPPRPGLDEMLQSSGLAVSGYVAASYYASNGYPVNAHQFDTQHNSFQLDQAGLQVAYQPDQGVGALLDVIGGEDARVLHKAEDGHDNSLDLRQAYVQYATGPLTLIAGKYVTLAGTEVINPTLNTNFSRSLLFFDSEPMTHTGIRASYGLTDHLTAYAGVNNGWNITSTSYGPKTGEFGLSFMPPNKGFMLMAYGYIGKTEAFGANKTLLDFMGTWNVSPQLSLVINFDWDRQDDALIDGGGNPHNASWHAAAVYVNYAITHRWRVSLRGEYLRDEDGFVTGAKQTIGEGTVTVGLTPVRNLEVRAEFRYDRSSSEAPAFYRTQRALAVSSPDSDSLSQFALQVVYKFSTPGTAP